MFCREVLISLEVGGRRLLRLDVCVLGVSLTTSTGSGTAERRRCHSSQSGCYLGTLFSQLCVRRCGGSCGTVVGPSRSSGGHMGCSREHPFLQIQGHSSGGREVSWRREAWARPLDVIRLE